MEFEDSQRLKEFCLMVGLYFEEMYLKNDACLPEDLTEVFLNNLNLYNQTNIEIINKKLNNKSAFEKAGLTYDQVKLLSPNAFKTFSMMLAEDLNQKASRKGFTNLTLNSNKEDLKAFGFYKDEDGYTIENILNVAGIKNFCNSDDYCTISIQKSESGEYSFKALRHISTDSADERVLDLEDSFGKYFEKNDNPNM